MTPQEMENGRRKIAKDCLKELHDLSEKTDPNITTVLDKYTPQFSPLNDKKHFPPKMVLGHLVRQIEKEMNYG
ncbi:MULTISPECIES: hypothetical protein [Providencia]|nr:hypothetical protein [Providencia rettgeri]EMA4781883.1 hypothetical protein [Providencia rettgeri]MDU7495216.1 hypothetical protein [Providencia rettgeri]HEM8307307.1 hypothetical protein [Providencia rettgeri]